MAAASDDVFIDPDHARSLVAAGARLVDVRTPAEHAEIALPGSLLLPLQELAQRYGELGRDEVVVLYCRSGARSDRAARWLREQGYARTYNAGGVGDLYHLWDE